MLMIAGTLLGTSPAMAEDTVEQKISNLEKQLAELKAMVKNQKATSEADQTPAPAPPRTLIPTPRPDGSCANDSGTKREVYGFVRLDASYDSGRITPGNIALYVPSEGTVNNDGEWNITGNATRLGVNLCGPNTDNMKIGGNVEFDFLSGATENASNPRLRHGYLKAIWPASDFNIIAGQTWDLTGSLIPFVDDPAIMWDAGNIGGRHPQLRLTKEFNSGEKSKVEIAGAVARTIGESNVINNATYPDPGKNASIPTVQGRVALTTPLVVSDKPATIAVSGHYGQEEWDTAASGTRKTLDTWSCVLELSLPLSQQLQFAGELFTGENLDDYWGGIGQGVNKTTLRSIGSHGGWAALRYKASPDTMVSIGAGMDDPDDNDLWSGARSLNETQFISVSHTLAPHFILGGQLSRWRTEYIDATEGDAIRAQSSLTYTF